MVIQCTFGKFKIIQTVSKKDQMLILSSWESLKNLFDIGRVFLVNKRDAVFGVYLGRNECLEKIHEMLKNVDYKDWDYLHMDQEHFLIRPNA